MRWDERLGGLFEDLEQQAEGLALAERDVEVAELSRAEYAGVDLASRLHASTGRAVSLRVRGAGVQRGVLVRVGRDWCLVRSTGAERAVDTIVSFDAVDEAEGLASGAMAEPARGLTAKLGLGSALRGIAEAQETVLLQRVDGHSSRVMLGRVGADFLEAAETAGAEPRVVRFSAIAAVHSL
ncbi:MAG TPA: hypothetical protein VFJ19_01125 [Nocardioidaceae bacterium]|nr:hypothetical protein [Nocardioidaceae bacterium]